MLIYQRASHSKPSFHINSPSFHHHFIIISSSFLRPKGGKKNTQFLSLHNCRPKHCVASILDSWARSGMVEIQNSLVISAKITYGYGSIPINTIFSGLFTSINPSYFDVNYRGTRFWPIPIWSHDLKDADDFPKIPQAATGRAWAAEGGTTSTAAALKAGPGTWRMLSDWWANQQNGDL